MFKKYLIKNNLGLYLIRDKTTVDFHIKKDDYFGTLATIMELLSSDQILEDKKKSKKILQNLKNDLLYLQKNFTVIKK